VRRLDDQYGTVAEPDVFIDLNQTRYDVRGGIKFSDSWLKQIVASGSKVDYAHTEFEGPGNPGTVFTNEGWEARVEAQQTRLAAQLGLAWSQWRSDQRQRELLESTRIPQAEANFHSALASYQVGEVDFNALLDALSQWQEAKLARLDAQRDELLAAAAVRAIEGEAP